MKFREPYKFEKIMEGEEDVGEDAPAEEKEEIEHELDESLPIINFASCTSDKWIEFMLDFSDLTDEEELLHFCVIYFAVAKAEEEAEAAEIAAWAE